MNDFDRAVGGSTAMPTAFIPDEAEELLQRLSASHEAWAHGAAKYGPGGTFDALRKRFLSVRSMEMRDAYAGKGEKVTEARLDELAHADTDYGTWLDESTLARAKWLTLDAERGEMHTRLKFLTYSPLR